MATKSRSKPSRRVRSRVRVVRDINGNPLYLSESRLSEPKPKPNETDTYSYVLLRELGELLNTTQVISVGLYPLNFPSHQKWVKGQHWVNIGCQNTQDVSLLSTIGCRMFRKEEMNEILAAVKKAVKGTTKKTK